MKKLLHPLAAVLIALLLTPLVAAQDAEQRRDAVREFKKYFRKYKTAEEKVAAVQTLEGMECPEAAEQLLKLLDHKDPAVRIAAMEVVTSYREGETFRPILETLPKAKNKKLRVQWIEVLGRAKIGEAVPVLTTIVLEDKRAGSDVRYEAARALGRIGQPDAAPALRNLVADQDPLVRLAAIDAIGALDLKELGDLVVPRLGDPEWQVRSSAVQAVGILRPQAAISPLIELMKEEGRIREECAEALYRITLLDFGVNPAEWEKQWARLQSVNWRIPTEEEIAKAAESRKRADAFYGVKSETTSFGGVTTTSTRVLFIIDVSGSMDEMVVERERFDQGYDNFQKLTIVKAQLMQTIEELSPNTYFNIVAFATDTDPWKKFLVPANIVNKSSAATWVKRLQPLGGSRASKALAAGHSADLEAGKTNTFKALMYAFGVDPDQPARAATTQSSMKNKLDTVFFLSDGKPSTGALIDTREILAAVAEINETYKIVFHTIAIGDFQKDFVRSLAEDSGGVFVDLGR